MNAKKPVKYERSFAVSRICLIASIDAGAVNDDVKPARVADAWVHGRSHRPSCCD